MSDWYSADTEAALERLLSSWPDAPLEREEVLGFLLSTSREQVAEYADPAELFELDDDGEPDLGEPLLDVPDRLVYAQLQQTINLWNAGRVNQDGEAGPDGYSYTPRPLDKTIKQIIRPKRGAPVVL